MTIKQKQYPSQGDDASTAEATPERVGRGEQCEARRANSAPNDGPHLELRRYGSKPGLNLTSRLLRRHGQHIFTCIYFRRFLWTIIGCGFGFLLAYSHEASVSPWLISCEHESFRRVMLVGSYRIKCCFFVRRFF